MAVTSRLYGRSMLSLTNKEIDLDTDAIKVMLTTSTYAPDQDVHQYKSSVTNEVTGTGYTARGATLASKTTTYTGATNVYAFDAADATWPSSTITARTAVVYDDATGVDATAPLIAYFQESADVSTTAGTFSVVFAAAGIFTVTVS